MKIKGQLTILCDKNGVKIEMRDDDARVMFAEVLVTPENFTAALGRLAEVDCEIEVRGLDKVGKVHECERLEFEIPKELSGATRGLGFNALKNRAYKACPDGWTPDIYFGSKGSFFEKDGKQFARCTIRRWSEKPK